MSTKPSIDINCDLGEGFGRWKIVDDARLMGLITSANVACGFHASDPVTMLNTVRSAKTLGVSIGAHPGLPDLYGFGRRRIDIASTDAYAYGVYQIGALQATVRTVGLPMRHVKAHGAFYDLLKEDMALGRSFAEAVRDTMSTPVLFWPAPIETAAVVIAARDLGVRVVPEIYADLNYDANGFIIPEHPQKMAMDVEKAYTQMRHFLDDGYVVSSDGAALPVRAETISVHGDGPNAVEVLEAVRRAIDDAGYEARPFDV
jgi:UPF0271 protein